MTRARLVRRRLLDPRPAAEATQRPIFDAVNIPLAELPERTHELPPRHEVVRVAGPVSAVEPAVIWMRASGRAVEVSTEYSYETREPRDPTAPVEIGQLWTPAEYLTQVAPRIPPGTALDVACGCGREAVYLASLGFAVTGIDVLPDALTRAAALAARCAPAIRPIAWVQCDLERDPPAWREQVDLITVFRYLHRPLLPRMCEWLRPGGQLVYETFTRVHRERYGKPSRAAFVLEPGELGELLGELEILDYSEDWRGPAHTARAWARRRG